MQTFISNELAVGFIILSVVTLALIVLVIYMHLRLRRFLIGVNSKNIEDSMTFVAADLKDLQQFRKEIQTYLAQVEKRLRKSVQSIHTVRFNPFKGTGDGGNQSFATAFLNEEGNGVVISSLYSRDNVRIFSKPVNKYNSDFELSDEEVKAIENAQNYLFIVDKDPKQSVSDD